MRERKRQWGGKGERFFLRETPTPAPGPPSDALCSACVQFSHQDLARARAKGGQPNPNVCDTCSESSVQTFNAQAKLFNVTWWALNSTHI